MQNYVRETKHAHALRFSRSFASNNVRHSASIWYCVLQVLRPEFVEVMCGNRVLPGSEPASHCYCGHQFGHFAGQLGDGCAQSVTSLNVVCMSWVVLNCLAFFAFLHTSIDHVVSLHTKAKARYIVPYCLYTEHVCRLYISPV